jgi:hypothetical protein
VWIAEGFLQAHKVAASRDRDDPTVSGARGELLEEAGNDETVLFGNGPHLG